MTGVGRVPARPGALLALAAAVSLALVGPPRPVEGAPVACVGLTDPNAVVVDTITPSRPPLYVQVNDATLGGCIRRITNAAAAGGGPFVPQYSQLQAWNADQTKIFLETGHILNTSDYSVFDVAPSMSSPRWSPVDPNVMLTTDGNMFKKYDIRNRQFTTLHTFTEYSRLDKDSGYEELPENGRYTMLEGYRVTDGGSELFIYDIVNDRKSPVLDGNPGGGCGSADWVAMSPHGDYAIVNWGGGGDGRYCGTEAYDLNMNYVGKVATGHGHGDLAVDRDGTQWYVCYTHDNYVGLTGPLIAKYRIPSGYDDWKAGDPTGAVSILLLDWYVSGHISCQAPNAGFCVASTGGRTENGIQPFEEEIFKVYLDGTEANPHVERLAHHFSDENYVGQACSFSSYWAQPHATISRDGRKIAFGSSWGPTCNLDTFLIEDSGGVSADLTPPGPPSQLRVR
ncbi:MAG: hypothetical protein HY568_00970 [Candidatus Latescibacteria bacterium]|nr:hypothetical protein [Candidatus Latescibacterota bacterium]